MSFLMNGKCESCLYRIEKEYSKSQFNMVWARIQDISNALRISKWDVYNDCLMAYGQSVILQADESGLTTLRGIYQVVKVLKAVDGIYEVQAWKGIQWMDSKELSIFTDGILQEYQNINGEV